MLFRNVVAAAFGLMVSVLPAAAQDFIAGIPRNEALIIQGPPAQNADWFNLWAAGRRRQQQRPPAADGRHLLVHQPGGDRRILLDQRARHRAAGLQRRLHPDDGEAPRGRLLERRRRVHRRRRGLHRRDPDRASGDELERAVHRQRRERRGAGPAHRGLQPQGAELALPHPLHRALERGLDHAEARLREGRGSAGLPEQPAGLAQRLRDAEPRPGRAVGDLEAARRLAAHLDRHDARRGAGGQVRRLPQRRQPGRAGHRADEPQPRRDQRHRARGHVHHRPPGRRDHRLLVRRLPVRASRPDAAVGDLQPPGRRRSTTRTSAGRWR